MPLELRAISAEQLTALPITRTVFFFPVGPLEDHGPHLPMGLDLIEARALCEAAAQRLEREMPGWIGVIMPDSPLGVETNTTETGLRVRAHVLRDWLIDQCRCLKSTGFLHFVCFSGHAGPRQLTTIEEAGKALMRLRLWLPFLRTRGSVTFISASSALLPPKAVRRAPFWPDPLEHGGRRDTSVALHLNASLSAEGYAKLPARARPASYFTRMWNRWTHKTNGYWGAPADGSSKEGSEIISQSIEDVFPKMRAVWEGANPNALFRSWYSVLPPNQSLFRIWLLALVLLVILWVWTVIAMRNLAF